VADGSVRPGMVVSIVSCRLRHPDAALGKPGDGVDQVAQRPAQPIRLSHRQGVARAELVQDLVEDWPVGAGAAGSLGEHPGAAGMLKGVDLEVGLLVGGGDAGVAEQMAHAMTVAEPCDSADCATLISGMSSGRADPGLTVGQGGCRRNERFCDRLAARLGRHPGQPARTTHPG
jgi:hypothetical protein